MTLPNPFPERLDPPDAASECAICRRDTEDGRDIELCDEAVEAIHSAAMIRLTAAVETGHQWVCDACLDDLHAAQERCRDEAFDVISDALNLDVYEHPALRARKVVSMLRPKFSNDDWSVLYRRVANASGDETIGEAMTAWFAGRLKTNSEGGAA